ncbi:NAD(P)/FAD-dependent oxidoreductase [Ensifer soli]|uniref:NAD(P)/FAD-dependent oxidoreductase n=1 Tax=Ciceribacter sp. sgz301302 TaxID=3342379 RepID=UPI0035B7E611
MSGADADVAVIGGGPAGVAAALELRRRGVARVVILDREPMLGGATRHCSHSPFGMREFGRIYLGAAYGRRLQADAERAGIDIRLHHSVVSLGDDGLLTLATPGGVTRLAARRVMIATGAREMPRSALLAPGDRPVGILTTGALQSYVAFHGLMPFRRPLIVGSELVSLSAVITCLGHGARPVAMIEPGPHPLARAPLTLLPRLAGIPFHTGATLVDIRGATRVETVTVRLADGTFRTFSCDGVLFTGRFTPEASLVRQSTLALAEGSAGPAIDASGRLDNPLYFAGGNVLRAVETGGWAFREGRRVGAAIAADLGREPAEAPTVSVLFDAPVKLVVPTLLRRGQSPEAFADFQLRFARRARGQLSLSLDGREVWAKEGDWKPERRILVPIPPGAPEADHIRFHFRERA